MAGDDPKKGGTYIYTSRGDGELGSEDLGGRRARKEKGAAKPAAAPEPAAPAPVPVPGSLPGIDDLEPSSAPEPAMVAAPGQMTIPATPRSKRGPVDERLAEVEKLVERGAWPEVDQLLVPEGAEPWTLPPVLRLLWAVAAKETGHSPKGAAPDSVAILAAAELLGVEPKSPLALVVAKRIVRKRSIAERPAPKPWISALMVLLSIAIGGLVGWFLSLRGIL
ncbi:MAG: hypothetical protein U0230_10180 [Polyangiales bacterium]